MTVQLMALFHSHIFQVTIAAAIAGGGGALRADWQAFKAMTTPEQFTAYNWKLAAFRAAHGAIVGAGTGFSASGALRMIGWM